jgi:hypothetical protein
MEGENVSHKFMQASLAAAGARQSKSRRRHWAADSKRRLQRAQQREQQCSVKVSREVIKPGEGPCSGKGTCVSG